jgi:hypothetical protein
MSNENIGRDGRTYLRHENDTHNIGSLPGRKLPATEEPLNLIYPANLNVQHVDSGETPGPAKFDLSDGFNNEDMKAIAQKLAIVGGAGAIALGAVSVAGAGSAAAATAPMSAPHSVKTLEGSSITVKGKTAVIKKTKSCIAAEKKLSKAKKSGKGIVKAKKLVDKRCGAVTTGPNSGLPAGATGFNADGTVRMGEEYFNLGSSDGMGGVVSGYDYGVYAQYMVNVSNSNYVEGSGVGFRNAPEEWIRTYSIASGASSDGAAKKINELQQLKTGDTFTNGGDLVTITRPVQLEIISGQPIYHYQVKLGEGEFAGQLFDSVGFTSVDRDVTTRMSVIQHWIKPGSWSVLSDGSFQRTFSYGTNTSVPVSLLLWKPAGS